MGTDLEDLETRLDVADILVSTYMSQSALEEIEQVTKSDAMLRNITEFIVHSTLPIMKKKCGNFASL